MFTWDESISSSSLRASKEYEYPEDAVELLTPFPANASSCTAAAMWLAASANAGCSSTIL